MAFRIQSVKMIGLVLCDELISTDINKKSDSNYEQLII